MPIKGLTDRGLAFPEIGQIRKGAAKNGAAPGKDLSFFRVTFDEKETEAMRQFEQVYGKEPTEIRIILPFNEIERMWDPWLEAYVAGRMVARADGEKYVYRVDPKTGQVLVKNGQPFMAYSENDRLGTWRNSKTGKDEPIKMKATGRLKVIVPELARAAYMTVLTTSVYDIGNISAQLEAFKQLNGGRIAGIPLILRRRPKKISCPTADGGRARYTKYMLSIEADPAWVKAKLVEVKRLALPGNGLALLPEGPHEQEAEEVVETQYYIEEDEETDLPSDPDAAVEETPPMPEPEPVPAPVQNGNPQRPASITEKAWSEWTAMAREAAALGIAVPNVDPSIETGDLRTAYGNLRNAVAAKKQAT